MFMRLRAAAALIAWVLASTAVAQMPPWLRGRPGRPSMRPMRPPSPPPRAAALIARVDSSLKKAAGFFVEAQSADGAWRSKTYGCFRDGPTLTPYVMSTLFFLPQGGDDARKAFDKGVTYLMNMVREDGGINAGPGGLLSPVYTAATASRVIVLDEKTDKTLRAQAAWLACLRERQLVEALGWQPSDPAYGGWGFSIALPRKPGAGGLKEGFHESNLSATVFGVAALKTAKLPFDDPGFVHALGFVKRCQNYSDDAGKADPQFDDGGFFFIP